MASAGGKDDRDSGASDAERRPRTPRGERTRARLLDAARAEFGDKGYGDASIVGITSRAGAALGTFYTYFDSKEQVFSALVKDMSARVAEAVAPALASSAGVDGERAALAAFLDFAAQHKEVYRIIDEAEFVDPKGYADHYRAIASRIQDRLHDAADVTRAEDALDAEVRAWAIMGMNVFLGLRFSIWGDEDADAVAMRANRLLKDGIGA